VRYLAARGAVPAISTRLSEANKTAVFSVVSYPLNLVQERRLTAADPVQETSVRWRNRYDSITLQGLINRIDERRLDIGQRQGTISGSLQSPEVGSPQIGLAYIRTREVSDESTANGSADGTAPWAAPRA